MREKKPKDSQFDTLKFIAIAVVLMVLADQYIFGGKRSYIENARQQAVTERMIEAELEDLPEVVAPPAVRVEPEDGKQFFEEVPETKIVNPHPASPPSPSGRGDEGPAKIAIIIDDLGMDVKRSRKIIALDAPLTLAFLPYAPKTKELALEGKKSGHSLIIHTPMEATNKDLNIGPIGLRTSMDSATFDQNFTTILASFEGYEGINNHMGSLLTQDANAMTHLMKLLKLHNLFFVDSRTINTSVAAQKAKEAGIPYASRDVFLDHVDSVEFVRNALRQTEAIAKRRGSAIAIGHPRDATIQGLKEWLPTLEAKGIEIVPVKELLVRPNATSVSSRPERSEAEGSPSALPDPSASLGMAEVNEEDSTVSVTMPDGTEQQIHLPPQQSPSPY